MYGRLLNRSNVPGGSPSQMPSALRASATTGCAGSIPVPSSAM